MKTPTVFVLNIFGFFYFLTKCVISNFRLCGGLFPNSEFITFIQCVTVNKRVGMPYRCVPSQTNIVCIYNFCHIIELFICKPHESTNCSFEKTKTIMLTNTLVALSSIYSSPRAVCKYLIFIQL